MLTIGFSIQASFLKTLKGMVDSLDACKSCLAYLEQIALLPNGTDVDMSALAKLEMELSRERVAKLDTGCKLQSLIIGGNLIEVRSFVEVC